MIDTHAHLYLDDFNADIEQVIQRCQEAGIQEIWLPAIDAGSLSAMNALSARYPGYFRQFAGLHPCDVQRDYRHQLDLINQAAESGQYAGIGEIGLDLYWDTTRLKEQQEALMYQLDLAVLYHLPVILHIRNAFEAIMPIIRTYYSKNLRGIFHSFAGNLDQARELTNKGGFLLGINGSITYKNSALATFIQEIPLEYLVTETDCPYLTPVPFRGKRNEPRHIALIIQRLASIYQLPEATIRVQCLANANALLA